MKYFICLAMLLLAGCSDFDKDNKLHTKFHYGDEVKIKTGFFENYTCTILQEYPKGCSLFCELSGYVGKDGKLPINSNYARRLNIDCDEVELFE